MQKNGLRELKRKCAHQQQTTTIAGLFRSYIPLDWDQLRHRACRYGKPTDFRRLRWLLFSFKAPTTMIAFDHLLLAIV